MPYLVVTSGCIGTKDGACAKVCPVACFYDAGEMLMIKADECICCRLCQGECPVNAIVEDDEVPVTEAPILQRAHDFFNGLGTEELEKLRVNP